jgi:hypothetical protein
MYKWTVIIRSTVPSIVVQTAKEFSDSGFSVTHTPTHVGVYSWRYSLTHLHKGAMTLHQLRVDCENFSVTEVLDV